MNGAFTAKFAMKVLFISREVWVELRRWWFLLGAKGTFPSCHAGKVPFGKVAFS